MNELLSGIGITVIAVAGCFVSVILTIKILDFFKDIHTIAENCKKE